MGVSRVDYAGENLIDLTSDTVNENNLLMGASAHGADGEIVNGAVITHNVIDNLNSTSSEDALSANQGRVLKLQIDDKGTYSKPSGGIPKTDLANDVKASLGKADSALQSYTETDPTVPAWAKQPNKPSYTADEVGAQEKLTAGSNISLENNVISSKVIELKKDEYDALPDTKYTDGIKYVITDWSEGGGGASDAKDVAYDNSQSGLESDNVQDAIDDVTESLTRLSLLKPLLHIVADSGSTITVSKGSKVFTPTEQSGVYECFVDEYGTWTISDGENSAEAYVDTVKIYAIEFSGYNGKTVTPTDNVEIWLKCARIKTSYTSLSQVLNDNIVLATLLSNDNANDYLARSTSWANDITSNENAMNLIGNNDYCASTLLGQSTWSNSICNSTYFEKVLNVKVPTMTSATTPKGEVINSTTVGGTNYLVFNSDGSSFKWSSDGNSYIGYKFVDKVAIKKVRALLRTDTTNVPAKWFVEASDDNVNWNNVGEFTKTAKDVTTYSTAIIDSNINYQYWRIRKATTDGYTALNVLQFYGREVV